MKALIIGHGGREHALAWKIKQDDKKVELYFWGGRNAGMSQIACQILCKQKLLSCYTQEEGIDLTIVGPEIYLEDGIVDEFQEKGLLIFGPNKEAAQIESSKIWAKNLMMACQIPTANYQFFNCLEKSMAVKCLQGWRFPLVIKADGLMAGKGVKICFDKAEAIEFIMTLQERFLIEEYLEGRELSFIALTDGETVLPLLPSQDYKQLYLGGPNTGGMGACAPADWADETLIQKIMETIMYPTIGRLKKIGIDYRGVLYAGLMVCDGKPYVLEFNCRFGDPETQSLIMLLETDLIEIVKKTILKELRGLKLCWRKEATACVVLISEGYPKKCETGKHIFGLDDLVGMPNVEVFHAGTKKSDGNILTAGGRVLNICGIGKTKEESLRRAYKAAERIYFEGMYYRQDIGQ